MTGISFARALIHFLPPLREFIFSKPCKVYETEKNLWITMLLYTVRVGLAVLVAAPCLDLVYVQKPQQQNTDKSLANKVI